MFWNHNGFNSGLLAWCVSKWWEHSFRQCLTIGARRSCCLLHCARGQALYKQYCQLQFLVMLFLFQSHPDIYGRQAIYLPCGPCTFWRFCLLFLSSSNCFNSWTAHNCGCWLSLMVFCCIHRTTSHGWLTLSVIIPYVPVHQFLFFFTPFHNSTMMCRCWMLVPPMMLDASISDLNHQAQAERNSHICEMRLWQTDQHVMDTAHHQEQWENVYSESCRWRQDTNDQIIYHLQYPNILSFTLTMLNCEENQ